MRTSFALAGLFVSLVFSLIYYDFVPAFISTSLPIQLPAYQLGKPKSYMRFLDPSDKPIQLVFNGEASTIFTSRGNGTVEEWKLASRSQVNVFATNDIFSYVSRNQGRIGR